ncbi:MAG: FkbM family methyltransferase [Gammaproteobacteria bacterium]|nr:FkbM family methyltransferase [Gammaproteobacteria bacterium]
MTSLRQLRRQLRGQPFYQRARRLARRLAGRELWLRPEIREPIQRASGWLLCHERIPRGARVFGLGVGNNISFELGLIRDYAATVDTFDPTPFSNEWLEAQELPPGFHHHPWAVVAEDGPIQLQQRKANRAGSAPMLSVVAARIGGAGAVVAEGYRLASIARRLDCPVPDLLRMDIEGAEYAVLDDMLVSEFLPRQLLVEFHHRFPEIGLDATRRAVAGLRAAGYRIAAVSDTGREVTFLRAF